jgi:hypothetical protein
MKSLVFNSVSTFIDGRTASSEYSGPYYFAPLSLLSPEHNQKELEFPEWFRLKSLHDLKLNAISYLAKNILEFKFNDNNSNSNYPEVW